VNRANPEVRVNQAGELRSARIESLRAVAALGVLTGHALIISHGVEPAYLNRILLGGGFGVFLFFALSGYLLFWPFARRDYGDGDSIDLRRYALNRAVRILPLYYFVLVVLLIFREDGGTLKQWLAFTTFSENFSQSTFGTVDGVMWSLVVELHFYAILPLLALGLATLARGSLRRAALLLGMLAVASFTLRLVTLTLDSTPNLYIRYSILSTFFFFVSGMLLALLRIAWRDERPKWLRGMLGSSTAWATASVLLMLLVWYQGKLEALTAVASFLLAGACILPLREGVVIRALEWRWLAAIGVCSYSIYLWHPPLLQDVVAEVPHMPHSFIGLFLPALAVSLLVAFLSYRLVEAPFLRLRRRWARSTPDRIGEAKAASALKPEQPSAVEH
jgi:acetyltransferase